MSLSLGRSARLGRSCKVQNGVRGFREVSRFFAPQSRAVFTSRSRSVSCLQVLVARYFRFAASLRLTFCFRICVVPPSFALACGSCVFSFSFSCFLLQVLAGSVLRLSVPQVRVLFVPAKVFCFRCRKVLAVWVAASTCRRYNFNSKAAQLNNCSPTRRCTRPPTAPFVPHFASGGG